MSTNVELIRKIIDNCDLDTNIKKKNLILSISVQFFQFHHHFVPYASNCSETSNLFHLLHPVNYCMISYKFTLQTFHWLSSNLEYGGTPGTTATPKFCYESRSLRAIGRLYRAVTSLYVSCLFRVCLVPKTKHGPKFILFIYLLQN